MCRRLANGRAKTSRARIAALAPPTPCRAHSSSLFRSIAGSCASAVSRSFSTMRSWLWTSSRRWYSRSSSRRRRSASGRPSAVVSLPKSIRVRRRFGSMPRMPLGEEQPLDAVDMTSTLSDQALALAMRTPSVFLFDRGHPNNGAHMALATVDRDESPQQGERIDAIGLHSTRPSIDLDACRIEDPTVDTDLCQRTRHPETAVTRLITDHDPLLL